MKFSPDPNSTRIVVSSWDKNVYLYDLRDENGNVSEGKLLQKFEHRAPVLDACFGENEDVIYTAGLDWDVRKYVFPSPLGAFSRLTVSCYWQDRCHIIYTDRA